MDFIGTNFSGKSAENEKEWLLTEQTLFVRNIAKSLLKKLPSSVQLDDLVQDGIVGLLEALLQTTKEKVGSHYLAYINRRVRGAMLDGLRDNDPGTRSVRRKMRDVEQAIQQLCHQLGRSPNEREVAHALAMPLKEYQRLLQDAHGYELLSIDDLDIENTPADFFDWCWVNNSDPVAALERREFQRKLLIAIRKLSPREYDVMMLRYVKGMSLMCIGDHLGLSEGRISQIHSQIIAKLRATVIEAESAPALLAARRRIA